MKPTTPYHANDSSWPARLAVDWVTLNMHLGITMCAAALKGCCCGDGGGGGSGGGTYEVM